MKIAPISLVTFKSYHNSNYKNDQEQLSSYSFNTIFDDLNWFATINRINHNDNKYNITINPEELEERYDKLGSYKMLTCQSPEFQNLDRRDQIALSHLVKAARALNKVYLRQDNKNNIPFYNYLMKVNEDSSLESTIAIILFNAQNGINGKDTKGNTITLDEKYKSTPGKGFYPEDLSVEEFHEIINNMLKEGKDEEVKVILNQRSIVVRDGKELKGIDYTDYFKKEFRIAANEIEKAAKISTNKDFNKFLHLQAKALRQNSPILDAKTDIQWAKLQNTPLEFTISRECYEDKLTPTISENKELQKLLDEKGILVNAKDNIGVRVGIVNKKGTNYILKIKEFLPLMADNMPYKNEYEQKISTKDNKQTMVDSDIVDLQGHMRAFRGGISLASNLPNDDKLALKVGGGLRNVYHRQVRNSKYATQKENANAILQPEYRKYYNTESLHDFTILHENLHSLGPKKNLGKLGIHKNVIEENKADMGALVMLDVLTQKGFYTKEQEKEIITSYIAAYAQSGPDFENAHRKRNIMQNNYFIQNGGIKVDKNGQMAIDYEKIIELAKECLEKIIRIQIDLDPKAAKEYIDKYAVWTPEMALIANNFADINQQLNYRVETPLGDYLNRQKP